ncbi:MAG: 2-hydroxyacyl-CoA dehydratase, partial [Oscillospiraceae bacterium]|nr:2-hydroxyacyl-CoA dehydratase [Oscillospiraceae bacterium]
MHGHTQWLIDQGIKTIFYPCMSYNLDEGLGDNHYNCPVVAYYPEVLAANMPDMEGVPFIKDYLGLHRPKDFPKHIFEVLQRELGGFTLKEVEEASRAAYAEYESYMTRLRRRGEEMIAAARAQGKPIIILVGRPYHADPEVNHGIDQLIAGFNVAVVTEDAILEGATKEPTGVLNQWTYHARLYAAARTACRNSDMNLVQLVSFGCGVDAITTDEVREILEGSGKIYTQIKIDEITNLGAVKIRLRSLLAALGLE